MEGYLFKKGRGDSTFGRHNWKRRWFVLENNTLTYYESFDLAKDEPVVLKGTTPVDGSKVEVIQHKEKQFCFSLKHDTRKPLYMHADNEKEMNAWLSALNTAASPADTNLLTEAECLSLLNIKDSSDALTPAIVNKAYRKTCLKVHPDKGGDVAQFKKVQEAFDYLNNKLEEEEFNKKYNTIQYECSIEKGPKGVGFGMLVAENIKKKEVSVKQVNDTILLRDITEPAKGIILKGDIIVKIGKDNVMGWPLARVVQRLSDFRIPVGTEARLTLTRRVNKDGSFIKTAEEVDDETYYANQASSNKAASAGSDSRPESIKRTSISSKIDLNNAADPALVTALKAENDNLRNELVDTKRKLSAITNQNDEMRVMTEDLSSKYKSSLNQINELALQLSSLKTEKIEVLKREEYALMQLNTLMSMSAITNEQLTQSLKDAVEVAINVKSGVPIEVPREVEDYLNQIGLTDENAALNNVSAAQRKALSAAVKVDSSGTILRKWDIQGDTALEKLKRLEERLQKLATNTTSTTSSVSVDSSPRAPSPMTPTKSLDSILNKKFNKK